MGVLSAIALYLSIETKRYLYKLYILVCISVYEMLLTKKDVIRINQEFADGSFQNESSLDYAVSTLKYKKSWLYDLSQLSRALLVDHTFRDGNKRTTLALILLYFEEKNIKYDRERLLLVIEKIAKKNINNINKVMGLIRDVIV